MSASASASKQVELLLVSPVRITEHRGADDLLSAGLGLDGLRSLTPPAVANLSAPSAGELRRRAIWSNWRGIADLSPGGGFEEIYGPLPRVPGREIQAFAQLPGATHPHRVLLQLPDAFDARKRCVVVAPSSGSRGVYGAIALAGPWALARGCAVVYTDKGTGSGWFDLSSGQGAGLDGTLSDRAQAEFAWNGSSDQPIIAFKHAHSGDNPEAQWGLHVQQAALFALQVLNEQRGKDEPAYDAATTRVLAVGVSNGGGAVLRAAELESSLFDGVVAISPNTLSGSGGRTLFDYGTEAAVLMPCVLADARFDGFEFARPAGAVPQASAVRCASLHEAGLLESGDLASQAAEAYEKLMAAGWTAEALQAAALSTAFDLWRAIGAAYASAYARSGPDAMPCGFGYAMLDEQGKPKASNREERALWWSDTAGVPPAAGVVLLDALASGADAALPALQCLRQLAVGDKPGALALGIRQSVEETRARLPRAGLPIVLMHGTHDGLVPEAFTSGPYSVWLRENDRPHTYWRLEHAQHFDAFLGLPPLARRYLPLLPYAWRGMDALWNHLEDGIPLPNSATIRGRPRTMLEGALEPLGPAHLALPELSVEASQ